MRSKNGSDDLHHDYLGVIYHNIHTWTGLWSIYATDAKCVRFTHFRDTRIKSQIKSRDSDHATFVHGDMLSVG